MRSTDHGSMAAPRGAAPGARCSLRGLPVSAGIAIGTVHVLRADGQGWSRRPITADQVDLEHGRLDRAVRHALDRLDALRARTAGLGPAAREELEVMLDAHAAMLSGSRLIRDARARVGRDLICAEAAVQAAAEAVSQAFVAMDDPYLAARSEDIRDVVRRLMTGFEPTPGDDAHQGLPDATILIADELSPAEAALLDPRRVAGLAAASGGREGHTAIIARALGLPAVFAAPDLLESIADGDPVIVDGEAGLVIVDPDRETLTAYRAKADELRVRRRRLERLSSIPATTQDGHDVMLEANMELPIELDGILEVGAQGIGLLRTEFQFMNRDDLPGEDEQFEMLREIVGRMDGRTTVIRTLDVGGEKLASSLGGHLGDSPNPALGLRAIRLSLKVPELLETQLAAILRAAALGPVRILLPMVSTTREIVRVREMVRMVAERLAERGERVPRPLPPVGAMIEIPGAALSADALAREADFFAIGTNDLTMYTLAIDRGDEQVAQLYDPLNPAVLRLIQFAIIAALRSGIPVSVCGEMAGDPRYTALLLGLGCDRLSMAATSLPTVKERVRELNLAAASRRAQAIMDQSDSERIHALLNDFNGRL